MNPNRKEYFANESYLSFEDGYPERNAEWFQQHILPDILKQLPDRNSKRLLDVGCAAGYFTRILSVYFFEAFGIDFDEKRITYAQRYANGMTSQFEKVDLTVPFTFRHQFDYLFSNAVIPHIPLHQKVQVFDNLARVAATGATFLLYDGKTKGVIDDFVGLFSPEWLQENVKSWQLQSCDHIIGETYRYVLTKA